VVMFVVVPLEEFGRPGTGIVRRATA